MQPPRVAIYTRISKDRSRLSENTGIQLRECLEYAEEHGWQVVAEFEENDISASRYSKKPRPLYGQLVELVRRNKVDRILATEGERLHRRPEEMAELITLAETTSLTHVVLTSDDSYDLSDADGIYRARIAVANGERESRKISKRQKRKKLAQAREGKPTGGRRPYAYEPDMITVRESEAAVLRQMADMVIGGLSCRSVAYWLNGHGHQTTTGKLFYAITVRNLLRKPRYAGIREHLGVHYPAVWRPVLDAETWERLQLALDLRASDDMPALNARRFLLTGMLVCGRCGGRLTGSTVQDRPGTPKRRIYSCRPSDTTKRGCFLRRGAEPLDYFIREAVLYRLDTPELGNLLAPEAGNESTTRGLLADRQAQRRRIDALVEDYATRLLNREQLARAKQAAEAELQRIEADIDRLHRRRRATGLLQPGQTAREAWERADDEWRRQLIGLLVETIEVLPGASKPFFMADGVRYRFDPSLIIVHWRV